MACRVLSALLGIGIAERSWGAVKHLKNGKRSHLGLEATMMQATIFGAACIEKARTLKAAKEEAMELWVDDDVEFQLGLENFAADEAGGAVPQLHQVPRRLFRTWCEDWEAASSKTNDYVHETNLLTKYGGLRWLDPDTELMYVAEKENMEWRRCLGWCVIGLCENGELEPWPVKMLASLIKKTEQEASLNVHFVHLTPEEKKKRKEERAAARALAGPVRRNGKRKRGVQSDTDSSDDE